MRRWSRAIRVDLCDCGIRISQRGGWEVRERPGDAALLAVRREERVQPPEAAEDKELLPRRQPALCVPSPKGRLGSTAGPRAHGAYSQVQTQHQREEKCRNNKMM